MRHRRAKQQDARRRQGPGALCLRAVPLPVLCALLGPALLPLSAQAQSPAQGVGGAVGGAVPGLGDDTRASGSGGLLRRGAEPGAGFGGAGLASGTATTDPGGSQAPLPALGPDGRPTARYGSAKDQALSNLLRLRARPPRRVGSPVRRPVREVTQIPAQDLRLTPLVQNPVSGIPLPLPAISPILGLVTPGFLLVNALRPPLAVDDAYAPLGIKIGTFTVLPSFTQSVGYDSNPDQLPPRLARGSAALRSEAELAFRSDWSSSSFSGELRGGYFAFPQNEAASRPNGAGNMRFLVQGNRDLTFNVEGRFLVDTQRTTSVDLQAATATSRPLIATYGTTVGATQTFNRLSVSLRGLVDRAEFEDARLSDGTVIRQSDRNQNQFGLRLRAAYEISPTISPFVDVLADTRIYDLARDVNGLRRNSDGVAVTAGASFAMAARLTGEISAGLQHRTYVDSRLTDINAPLFNAALVWSMSPLTTVRLGAQTGVTETTLIGSSGALTEAATLEVQHDLLRNLSLTLGGAYLRNVYQGLPIRDTGFSATARLDYRFTRWLSLRGSYVYQQIESSVSGASFSDNTFLVGLRVSP